MSDWTKEPWFIIDPKAANRGPGDWAPIMAYEKWGDEEMLAQVCCPSSEDSRRIVACVNALAGIDDPEAFMRDVRTVVRVFGHLGHYRDVVDVLVRQLHHPANQDLRGAFADARTLLAKLEGTHD